jgi:anti-sigma regulatory factor (Ser/Thr protein kinase)
MHSSPGAATMAGPARPASVPGTSASLPGTLDIASTPAAVGLARNWTAGQLASASPPLSPELIEDAVLAVSELVTNAIAAVGMLGATPAGSPGVSLVVAAHGQGVRIEVADSSPAPLPVAWGEGSESDESGRGLSVVDALAEHWGWRPGGVGKVVWCELASSLTSSWLASGGKRHGFGAGRVHDFGAGG